MTALIFLNNAAWTLEYLKDALFWNLAFYPKYYEQAESLLYRIPVKVPPPSFKISLADLWDRVVVELENCTRRGRQYVLLGATERIFENVDHNYYHLSVKRKLVVELVE
jgi:hypothetical protein